jgi:hypothetical protein
MKFREKSAAKRGVGKALLPALQIDRYGELAEQRLRRRIHETFIVIRFDFAGCSLSCAQTSTIL